MAYGGKGHRNHAESREARSVMSGLYYRDDGIRRENKQGYALFDGNSIDFLPWKEETQRDEAHCLGRNARRFR